MSADFAGRVDAPLTTLCHCWLVERSDGVKLGFTDHDRPLAFAGTAFEPQSGFTRAEASRTAEMTIDAADVEGALSSDTISEADIAAGLYDGARVVTYLVDWRDVTARRELSRAAIGKITRADGRFVAELESLARSLDRPNGRYLRRQCDAELGDARCRADLSAARFSASGHVTFVLGSGAYVVEGLEGVAAGWFSGGRITWRDGALAGRSMWVGEHKADMGGVRLVLPADLARAQEGDAFDLVAGCDKSFATCREKFGNFLNFRGFPHLPGNDAAYAYVVDGVEFDGGALVE